MKLNDISKTFKPKFVKPEDKDIPTINAEQLMLMAFPTDLKDGVYVLFYKELETLLSKFPNSNAKVAVQKLIDRHLIYYGINIGSKVKNGIIGKPVITNSNKLAAIIVEANNLDINIQTAESPNYDLIFYTAYYQFIRAAIILNVDKVKNNYILSEHVIKYLFYVIMKTVGINLNVKQKEFLEVLCSYFYYRFMFGSIHEMAKEQSLKNIDKDSREEIEILIPRLQKYRLMNDIFKGLVDFNITNEPPASLMIKTLSRLKTTSYYSLTSSLDHLIAMSIVSMYPFSLFRNSNVSSNLQSKIEKIIVPLINSVKFDISTFAKI